MHIRSWMTIGLLAINTSVLATPTYPSVGISLGIPLVTKDPQHLHGYRAALWYQPESLIWDHVHIYFDASFGRWWVTNTTPNNSLNIYAIAPTLRYYFKHYSYFSPFLNVSIGAAYLTKTKLDGRNLGMHFAFQDQLGIGATLGAKQQFSLSLSAIHYSNGSLCRYNAGITVPVMFNIEYGFS